MTILYKLKMVMIGEAGAGKSCIIHRFIYSLFNEFGNATIGAQFLTKEVNNDYKLDIWDTAGQERFRSLIPMYLRNASIVCLVVGLDSSNEQIETEKLYWLSFMDKNNYMVKNHKKMIIYNKFDLRPNFQMVHDDRFDYCTTISCKTNHGFDDFSKALDNMVVHLENSIMTIKPHESAPQPVAADESPSGLNFYKYIPGRDYISSIKCNIL